MAATVTNTPETKSQAPRPRSATALALASVFGAAYVVVALAAVFWGVPQLWASAIHPSLAGLEFVSYAVLGLLMLAAAGGLIYLGRQLAGARPPVGLRAGITTVIVALLVALGVAV